MAPDDGPDERPSGDEERGSRERDFSRRELLRAGSAVPVVLSAGWLAACGSHGGSHGDHTDAPHNDAAHTDTHTDGGSHSDHGHSDTGGHSDTHSDTAGHSDTHSDGGGHHTDAHGDHTGPPGHADNFYQDRPPDGPTLHDDSTVPGIHDDSHGDSP